MKIFIKIQTLIALLFFSYCGANRIYTIGSYGSLKSYTEKQHYEDKKTTETYLSGDLSIGKQLQEGGLYDDIKTILSINAHQNTTGRFYNYYYGLGASRGTYTFKQSFQDLIQSREKQNFYNIFLKAGGNITYSRPKIDYRFIGLEFGYLYEYGPYQNKLDKLKKADYNTLKVVNQKFLLSYHFYSEYAFKISKEEALTFGFYLGDILNLRDYDKYDKFNNSGYSFGFRFKDYTAHLMFESGNNGIRSGKFGLTYRL